MKKIFDNRGMSLVEVIAAAVIMSIVGAAILSTILQTTKLNVSSDVEIRMKAAAEQVIEDIKANKGATTIGTVDYSAGVYYDKLMNPVPVGDSRAYYQLTASTKVKGSAVSMNTIDTKDNYDRWDFRIDIQKSDSTNSKVTITSNGGLDTLNVNGGKNFKDGTQSTLTGANMTAEIKGEIGVTNPYSFNYSVGGSSSSVAFTPGAGNVTSGENNIVLNINKTDNIALPVFTIDLSNNTVYSGSLSNLYVITDPVNTANKILGHKKNVIVNVFNDDPNIIINPNTPQITINRFNGAMPSINNGYKVDVTISLKASGQTVKDFPSVVE